MMTDPPVSTLMRFWPSKFALIGQGLAGPQVRRPARSIRHCARSPDARQCHIRGAAKSLPDFRCDQRYPTALKAFDGLLGADPSWMRKAVDPNG